MNFLNINVAGVLPINHTCSFFKTPFKASIMFSKLFFSSSGASSCLFSISSIADVNLRWFVTMLCLCSLSHSFPLPSESVARMHCPLLIDNSIINTVYVFLNFALLFFV